MTKNWRLPLAIVAVSVVAGGLIPLAQAAEADPDEKDITSYQCKQVMLFSGPDRDIAVAILHAYLLGKAGTPKFSPAKLGAATDRFLDYCLDNPTANALEAMVKAKQ